MRRTACLLLRVHSWLSPQPASKHRVLFNRFRVPEIALFVADADGKNELALPHRRVRVLALADARREVDRFHLRTRRPVRSLSHSPGRHRPGAIDRRPGFRRSGLPLTRRQESGLRLHTGRRLRKSLAARYRQPQIPKPHTGPLGKFPAELVTGRPLDRLQFRSRCQSRKVPRAVGAHAVYRASI